MELLLDKYSREFLENKGAEYAGMVKEFRDNCMPVYEGDENSDKNAKAWSAYELARSGVEQWLRAVLLVDLAVFRHNEARAVLYLPDRNMKLSATSNNDKDIGFGLLPPDGYRDQMLYTPIGQIDYFTYMAITQVENNPVDILYRHLSASLRYMHNVLSMPEHDRPYELLHKELLVCHNIQDPLEIYKLDGALSNVDSFLDKKPA